MLQSLHVKNLALIDEAEVFFQKGLNILTGETGAGKSIIVGSINLALGEKIPKDMVRDESIPAFVELVFSVDTEHQRERLNELMITPENNEVILSRKISGGRSVARVNSETVTVSSLKEVASIFVDIYGQHEHQTLLQRKKHLVLLDSFGKEALLEAKEEMKDAYEEYAQLRKRKSECIWDASERKRELELLEYEISEIEAACLKEGEDEELEERYRLMQGASKVAKSIGLSYEMLYNEDGSVSSVLGRCMKELSGISDYNSQSSDIFEQLVSIEDLVNQLGREMSAYLDDLNFSEEDFYQTEQRLDVINRLKDKYGSSIEDILDELENKKKRQDELNNYELFLAKLDEEWQISCRKVEEKCNVLSEKRQKLASELTFKVTQALIDLNFLDVKFDMQFDRTKEPNENGFDDPQFMISVNPGEPLKPLDQIASGGELSRIMLAMKSVLASNDKIGTLIFDEIDTGISGRTAQMVSEKMNDIGHSTQVISITHLPQIAAMADAHYLIQKEVREQNTVSSIKLLDENSSCEELARMLGGVSITDAVLNNAKEMRQLALSRK